MNAACAICGAELMPPLDSHYVQVAGWEKPGRGLRGNSGSSLILRKRTGALAHSGCIIREQHGVVPGQMTLTEMVE